MGKAHPEMGGGELPLPSGFPSERPFRNMIPRSAPPPSMAQIVRSRKHCVIGCDRLDGHDGRDAGACMENGSAIYRPWDTLPDGSVIGETTAGELSDYLAGGEWPPNLPPAAIQPYDLAAPAKLLGVRIRCRDASCDVRELALAAGEDVARIVRYDYGACKAGCCEPYTTVDLCVPYENLPHCQSCECGSDHRITLSKSAMGELKALLP
jgi:hypothetical protein